MKHKWHKCNCNSGHCMFCDGGLGACDVCGGLEGTLTTDCCGRRLTQEEEDKIYKEGTLDFQDGKWVSKSNYPRTEEIKKEIEQEKENAKL